MHLFQRQVIQGNTVITLEIQSLDATNAERVTQNLAVAMRGEDRVVVDLGALQYFDVSGFAAILKWATGGLEWPDVRLCSQSGTIQALFELLGANTVIPLFQSREEAIASFGRLSISQHAGV
jgi:anti-anti-sigma factor